MRASAAFYERHPTALAIRFVVSGLFALLGVAAIWEGGSGSITDGSTIQAYDSAKPCASAPSRDCLTLNRAEVVRTDYHQNRGSPFTSVDVSVAGSVKTINGSDLTGQGFSPGQQVTLEEWRGQPTRLYGSPGPTATTTANPHVQAENHPGTFWFGLGIATVMGYLTYADVQTFRRLLSR
jgi:hypothetical protein